MTFLSVCYTNIRTNSTYYLQHTTDWTELNVLLYDGTRVFTGLLLCAWLRLKTLNKRIWWWWWRWNTQCPCQGSCATSATIRSVTVGDLCVPRVQWYSSIWNNFSL